MNLARISHEGGVHIAAVQDGQVFPVPQLLDGDMANLAANWDTLRPIVERALGAGRGLPLETVKLLPPIGNPGKILAIGLNYADHIAESGLPRPEAQTWFCKMVSSLNGPFDPIEVPRVSDALDYEAELVAIIGRGGRHISRADAPSHVFGYCAGNDVSVRDWQLATSQWMIGKSFDTHAPIGPWITTADELTDPHSLGIRCFVNGEERQKSNTRELVFDVWAQIEHLSHAMTLSPGDVIFTGTPGGVGFALKPPHKLKHGDRVRVEIDQLGAIENECRDEV